MTINDSPQLGRRRNARVRSVDDTRDIGTIVDLDIGRQSIPSKGWLLVESRPTHCHEYQTTLGLAFDRTDDGVVRVCFKCWPWGHGTGGLRLWATPIKWSAPVPAFHRYGRRRRSDFSPAAGVPQALLALNWMRVDFPGGRVDLEISEVQVGLISANNYKALPSGECTLRFPEVVT